MTKVPMEKPTPDIDTFVSVIRGELQPSRPPLVELFLDHEIVREISRTCIGRQWVEPGPDRESQAAYWDNWIEVYHRMGYDYLRVRGGLDFPTKSRIADDTNESETSRGQRGWTEEGTGIIATWDDFEKYPWPDPAKSDIWNYEYVADRLPEGMGLFVCPDSGFLEIPLDNLLGYENLCYLLYDDPALVEAVFNKVGQAIYGLYKNLLGLPGLRGFFQGDDMGYKTSTMISADHLRKLSLPWHKKLAQLAHDNGLVYLLHSCGQIDEIMQDLITDVKIDGRHSFEDEGNPVIPFKQRYGDRIAVLGGVDLDRLCRLQPDDLRAYVRNIIESCNCGGRFAIGSGNSVCNYVPLPNYLTMVDEVLNYP